MNILHMGKKTNMTMYPDRDSILRSQPFVSLPAGLCSEEYTSALPEADVIIADAIAEVNAEMIMRMPKLKLIHSEGVAYNRIDTRTADKRGVFVCNCAGMNGSAVAEHTLLMMLGVIKNVANNDHVVRTGKQIQVKEGYMAAGNLLELADCKVGLIGFGNIGQSVSRLLSAFAVDTYYYKRHRLSLEKESLLGVSYLPLEDLLHTCDIISLHVPVTDETRGMCDRRFFSCMKNGSFLINTSRGELVREDALVDALASGKLFMAGLDTICNEPVQPDHILLNQPPNISDKILFSPHIAGITSSSFRRGYAIISENVRRISCGENPVNIVNAPLL